MLAAILVALVAAFAYLLVWVLTGSFLLSLLAGVAALWVTASRSAGRW